MVGSEVDVTRASPGQNSNCSSLCVDQKKWFSKFARDGLEEFYDLTESDLTRVSCLT